MNWLELFAGAGGAALGIRRAGGQAIACIELDGAACASLEAANFPAVQADINEWSHAGPVDCLWSSFPCQAWSTAGKRLGAADSRNGWPSTLRIVDESRPRWVVLENVRGLALHAGECDGYSKNAADCPACYFHRDILGPLRLRYESVSWNVLNAADYGLPQHRRRVFVVAGPHRIRWPEPTHGAPGMAGARLFGEPLLPWATFGAALGLSADQSVIGGGRNPGETGATDRRYRDLTGEPSTTVAAVQIWNAGPFVIDGGRNSAANMIAVRRSQADKGLQLHERPLDVLNDQPAPTITATYGKVTREGNARGGVPFLIAVPGSLIRPDNPSPTITGGGSHHYIGPGIEGGRWWDGRRRLTTAECATLQGFPPGHKFHGSQVQQYRQIGNAVPPQMAELLARAIYRSDHR